MSTSEQVDATLDTQGLYCPEPIMMMHQQVADMASGDLLRVVATDPATERDIPQFCAFLGHQLVSQQERDGAFEYLIRLG